jgi:hypothetical protein
MIWTLRALFGIVLACMIGVTALASQDRSVFLAFGELLRDPWGLATLADAYFGFLTFYVWVAYKEAGWLGRGLWFVLIMAFGNIAMALYMLLQLFRVPSGASLETILLRSRPRAAREGGFTPPE